MKPSGMFAQIVRIFALGIFALALSLSQYARDAKAAALRQDSVSTSAHASPVGDRALAGESIQILLSLENVPASGLTGADFSCHASSTLMQFENYQEKGFFGADPAKLTVESTGDGNQRFVISRSGANLAAQSGAVFQLDYLILAPGQAEFNCQVWVTDAGNTVMEIPFSKLSITTETAATAQPTPTGLPAETSTPEPTAEPTESPTSETPTSTPQAGEIDGIVSANRPVSINLINAGGEVVATTNTDNTGSFSFQILTGTYTLRARAEGYLDAEGLFTVNAGEKATAPSIRLLAGDINADNVIDELDVVALGMLYGQQTSSPADLNGDGVINLSDLTLLGANYRQHGPQSW